VKQRRRRAGGPAAPRRAREQLVEAIVAAATELFAAGEQRAVTVRAIAARAGVQPSVIHRYFTSKQALLGEVVSRGARRDAEILGRLGAATPPQVLAATLENGAYRAALLHGVLAGLRPADVPGGLPSLALSVRALEGREHSPAHPGERYDPRLIVAVLAAALVGWQATGRFFTAAVGLDGVDPTDVQAAVAYLLDQVNGLAGPDRTMEDG